MTTEGDYRVGYGKPPQHSRFKKGESGNARGRPKRATDFPTALAKVLQERITIEEKGKKRKVTKLVAIIVRLMNRAASGELEAIKILSRYHLRKGSPAMERKKPIIKIIRPPGSNEII